MIRLNNNTINTSPVKQSQYVAYIPVPLKDEETEKSSRIMKGWNQPSNYDENISHSNFDS